MHKISSRPLQLGCAVALLVVGWTARASDSALKDVAIVVNDEPYLGELIPPPTDTEFQFKLKETGEVLAFRWSMLAPTERTRIQKIFGIEMEDGQLVWGDPVQAVRFTLKTGKKLDELEQPDRALPGHRCLKTYSQVVHISHSDIETEEPCQKRECELYSPKEYYERKFMERPPGNDNAADHIQFAQLCSKIGLYDKAIDHLEMAKVIDARTVERTEDFRNELVKKHAEQQADRLYNQILLDKHAEAYASAKDKIETFMRNFPYSVRRTAVEAMMPEVDKKALVNFSKQIIFSYYHLMHELILEKMNKKVNVDAKGRPIPAMPGKQITTRQGHIFRGELISDTDEKVTLKQGDTSLEITAKDVLSKQDIDLSKSFKQLEPTFAELKRYVQDANGGLGRDIAKRISEKLRVDEAKIKDTWNSRFARTASYDGGEYVQSPVYTSLHNAYYGKGSWLRDGAQFVPSSESGLQSSGASGGRNTGGGRVGGSGGTGGNNAPPNTKVVPPPEKLNPDFEDDPELWWKAQPGDNRSALLEALASEKLFRVKDVKGKVCPGCAGKGGVEIMGKNGPVLVRCATCRGMRLLLEILYE